MKALSNQKGLSFLEILVSLAIMASVTAYIAVRVENNRSIANDSLAQSSISEIESLALVCQNSYSGSDLVSSTDSDQRRLGCGDGTETDLSKRLQVTLQTLPEDMRVNIENDATTGAWLKIAVRHDKGTEGSSSSDRTTFCSTRSSSDSPVNRSVISDSSSPLSASSCP